VHKQRFLLTALTVTLAILACNAPTAQSSPTSASDLEMTITALAATVQSQPGDSVATAVPQDTSQPGESAASTPTKEAPMVSVSVNTNCRAGPSTAYDNLGALTVGQSAEVVGKYTPANWWIIQNPSGSGTCWIWGQYASVTGDTSSLPEMTPPPPPTPTHEPTAVPQANLVAGNVQLSPSHPICSQTFTVSIDVTNAGPAPTTLSGTVSIIDSRVADGSTQATTIGGFPALAPGQTYHVNAALTVSTWYNQIHHITLTIDPSNQIPESNEGDNVGVVNYTLLQGSCP
jgi:uncharacterized protein YgiM (DUF1202 family)